MNLASNLALYAHTPLPDALVMPVGTARKFFEGKAFADWTKARDAELKTQVAVVDRLNNVIRACGLVAKAVARFGSRW